MITKILRGCTVLAFGAVCIPACAQTKGSWTFSCPLADDLQTVTAAAHGGIPFAIGQGKCSVTGDIAGSASKTITNSAYAENSGGLLKMWGVFVDTLASGDQVGYIYQVTETLAKGAGSTGRMTYQINVGTGSLAGISGSGTCTITANTSGGSDGTCTGQYTLFQSPPPSQ